METITVIFPHQLFKDHPAINKERTIYLIEESLYFNQFNFHKKKLILHRASMKSYADQLLKNNYTVEYIDAGSSLADIRKLIAALAKKKVEAIHYADVADDWLRRRMHASSKRYNIQLTEYPTPNFLNTPGSVKDFFDKKKSYFQTDFYTWQRKQRNILVDAAGQPAGGQWSFDAANRQRYPAKAIPPPIDFTRANRYVTGATQYVAKNFNENYGSDEAFFYPIDHAGAERWLQDFLSTRFEKFGVYEDAIVADEHFLHHSVLTPMLNIGLLSPQQVIDAALAAAPKYNVPINSLEGFIRQIMGWREFIHLVYEREGRRQRTRNYWGFTREIPTTFWNGETGIIPVDNVIKKLLKTGYSHHIERLMVMGNFMVLCEFDPDDVYRWFMEMYVDAYDWVMVPNVYGMTQFADGGLMMTKPYISGSNYLLKMGDYQKGPWTDIWDGLFWRFMHVHRDFFTSNPRLGMLLRTFDKWPAEKRNKLLDNAESFLSQLDKQRTAY